MVDLTSQIFLSAMGAFFLLAAVLGIVGRWKRWYWTSKRLVYIYLPIGILFLVAAVSQFFTDKTYTTVFQAVEFVLLGVGIWWVARPPDFLKPAWIAPSKRGLKPSTMQWRELSSRARNGAPKLPPRKHWKSGSGLSKNGPPKLRRKNNLNCCRQERSYPHLSQLRGRV